MNPDVIIVGAGVIGTACAYFLSLRGIDVLVFERSYLCAGASGASAALIITEPGEDDRDPLVCLKSETHRLLAEIEADSEQPIEMISGGSLSVAITEELAIGLKASGAHDRFGCRFLDGDEARRIEPLLGPQVSAALFNPADCHVNPFKLCQAYAGAAARRGAKFEYGVKVEGIDLRNGRLHSVITDRGSFHAEHVVLAAGACTPQLMPPSMVDIPIEPGRGQVIITEASSRMTERILFLPDHLYMKQTAGGNFYLGSHTEFVGFQNRITLEKITLYARALAQAVPMLAHMEAIRLFAGFRPISRDGIPVVGPLPDCPELIVASGHGRSGIMLSAGTGKTVSELIADGKTTIPIGGFSPSRFTGSTEPFHERPES